MKKNSMCRIPIATFMLFVLTACQKTETTHPFPLAEKHHIDEAQLITSFEAFKQVAGALSIIVARDGEIVAEAFTNYNNYGPENTKNVMSVTKSFTGLLVGLAIAKGYIENINDPIGKYLAGLVSFPDAVKANITIEQLLKMSFGHAWNGTNASSLYGDWMAAADHLQFIIDLPLVAPPGTVFNYSDGASHLLSVIIARATGQNTLDFAKTNLFDPLQITSLEWTKDDQGYPNGASDLQIKPRDMVKFGQLILDHGRFNGIQVVPESWIDTMITAKISTNGIVPFGPDYGYQIWIGSANGHRHIFAMGWGGQFIFVVPEQNLVVSATCWTQGLDWAQAGNHWLDIIHIIVGQVFPAVH